jgi:hypothetical protein
MVVSAAAITRASSATITEPIEVRPSTQRCSTVVRSLLLTRVLQKFAVIGTDSGGGPNSSR